nr:DsbC family protein [Photorhabdus heterorhabditis]
MSTAKDGGVVTPKLDALLSQMRRYKPKDAIFIPSGGLFVFEDEKKQLMAVTTTGRYTINGGSLVDVMKRTQLYSVNELRESYFIKLKEAPFPLSTVSSISLGNPKLNRQAAIFISLDCDGCQDLIKKFYDNREKYHVDVVLIPTPGAAKNKLRQLWCSKEKFKITDFDVLQWLTGNKDDVEKRLLSLEQSQECSVEPLVASLMLASVYNLQGIPSVVREDGLAGNGIPQDFDAWLKQSVEPLLKNPFASDKG